MVCGGVETSCLWIFWRIAGNDDVVDGVRVVEMGM
jgi:hypothetical protein